MGWTESYRPKTLEDVVGNGPAVAELREWAESWKRGPPKERAAILAGPPGVGKTSAAHALARDMGWNVVEMNASDSRNYDAIHRVATPGTQNATFSTEGAFAPGRLQLVILDEADNLFGNEDRGGMRAIVETVREARNPVLLIVNDLYEFQRKGAALGSVARLIKFSRINRRSMPNALRRIAQAEGIQAEPEALIEIAERSGGDLRSAINDFEALATGRTVVTAADVAALGKRDEVGDVWTLLGKVFYGTSADEARRAAWDLDETPEDLALWIDENIPYLYSEKVDQYAAFGALSRADLFLGRVTRRQQYGLWSYAGEMMTAGVAVAKLEKPRGARFQFPSWLRKMSASRGIRETRDGAATKIGAVTHTSRKVTRSDIIPFLRQLLATNDALAARLMAELQLEPDEMAYLVAERPGSVRMKAIEKLAAAEGARVEGGAQGADSSVALGGRGKFLEASPGANRAVGARKGPRARAKAPSTEGARGRDATDGKGEAEEDDRDARPAQKKHASAGSRPRSTTEEDSAGTEPNDPEESGEEKHRQRNLMDF